mmetsp:Transcript_2504/g.5963  ORF Transcript_2504/g.5963 Transcript_2504/m.5963 type:complete len:703 (+) Transcript_2504:182-2290(+)|eukprot:CAMPEP_0113607594 /NCGR_PEP_ID=MMETSP0017_2-20120614/3469_1 /TAXON_ID=2856 /ORGANISM="Cylindrotheca closterium" /LENGTH=702 /DNA_ID=CAMNT_0000516211 /DNA_START=148 /DNA_END=2256 /DNA_ORIENTATION=+ /assembly_acc=CAM_ASM_000147
MPQIKRSIADYDGEDEAHDKLRAAADFNGPVEDRYCTDLLMLVLLCLCWAGMTAIGAYAVHNGDYRLVLYPLDYDGNVCGADLNDRDMTEYPYLYYTNAVGGVCVKECPSLVGQTADNATDLYTLVTYTGVYQSTNGLATVPADLVQVADYSYTLNITDTANNVNVGDLGNLSITLLNTNNFQCTEDLCVGNSLEASWKTLGINRGFGFAYYLGDSFPLFQRCFLTTEARDQIANLTNAAGDANDLFKDVISTSGDLEIANDFISNLYGDLWATRLYIMGFGFGVSLVVSLLYMVLLRIPVLLSALIWFSIFGVIGMFAIAGWFTSEKAAEWEAADPPVVGEKQANVTKIIGYVLYGIAAFLVLLAICMRKQIQLAVMCVKKAGAAVNDMVLIFAIPVLQGLGFLAFTAVWAWYSSHLASLGTITLETMDVPLTDYAVPVRTYEYSEDVRKLGWFLLFCFFWTGSFILAIGEMVIAMAVSKWYFTAERRLITQHLPFAALWSTIVYHLGTCAFGSLIIAIIKMLRAIMAYIKKQISETSNEKLANCLFCCCQCCLCCLEKCVEFINENAYIQCAIFGTPFCESGRKAFYLILRNAARIGAVSYVSAAVLVVGKLFIAALTTFLAYYTLTEHLELEVWSFGGPIAMIFIISYFVADMFMDVFDISILCVLHCFIADEEMFDGQARYADGNLKEFVDKHGGVDG